MAENNAAIPPQTEFVLIINRYFTPFAIALVAAGIAFSGVEPGPRNISIGLIVFTALLNVVTALWVKKRPEATGMLSNVRLVVNFVVNILLMDLLGQFWGPMWLLFVLTPVATALYTHWRQTLTVSGGIALILLGIYIRRGLMGTGMWAAAVTHCAFIVFLAMFVNAVAEFSRKHYKQ